VHVPHNLAEVLRLADDLRPVWDLLEAQLEKKEKGTDLWRSSKFKRCLT
jgi:hypothetical protein